MDWRCGKSATHVCTCLCVCAHVRAQTFEHIQLSVVCRYRALSWDRGKAFQRPTRERLWCGRPPLCLLSVCPARERVQLCRQHGQNKSLRLECLLPISAQCFGSPCRQLWALAAARLTWPRAPRGESVRTNRLSVLPGGEREHAHTR